MTDSRVALHARLLAVYNQNRDDAGKPTMRPSELAARFGISASSVRDVLRRAGLADERPQTIMERPRAAGPSAARPARSSRC